MFARVRMRDAVAGYREASRSLRDSSSRQSRAGLAKRKDVGRSF